MYNPQAGPLEWNAAPNRVSEIPKNAMTLKQKRILKTLFITLKKTLFPCSFYHIFEVQDERVKHHILNCPSSAFYTISIFAMLTSSI